MNPFSRSVTTAAEPLQDHTIDDPTNNCCFQFIHLSVTIIHTAELLFGLVLLGYGIAISTHQPDPQHGFAIILEIWSFLLIISGVLGTIGLNKEHCNRIPLKISSYLAPTLAIVDVTFFLILIIQKEALYHYVKEKHDELFLSLGVIDFFYTNSIAHVLVPLIVTALMELARFVFIKSLKEDLLLHDRAKRLGLLREEESLTAADRNQWEENPMSEPLISSNGETTSASNNLSTSNTNNNSVDDCFNYNQNDTSSQWWEENNQVGTSNGNGNSNKEEEVTPIEHEKKGFFSSLSWRRSNSRKETNVSDHMDTNWTNTTNNNGGSDDGGDLDLFSPVDEDLEFQEPASKAKLVSMGSFESGGGGGVASWLGEEDDNKEASNGPDLSWTQDN